MAIFVTVIYTVQCVRALLSLFLCVEFLAGGSVGVLVVSNRPTRKPAGVIAQIPPDHDGIESIHDS
jgi:hypothetical protein